MMLHGPHRAQVDSVRLRLSPRAPDRVLAPGPASLARDMRIVLGLALLILVAWRVAAAPGRRTAEDWLWTGTLVAVAGVLVPREAVGLLAALGSPDCHPSGGGLGPARRSSVPAVRA